jgi:hypothetical protein
MGEDQQPFICSNCGGAVEPFGTMRHWFLVDDDDLLCLACARELVPERVALAEAYEAGLSQSGRKTE